MVHLLHAYLTGDCSFLGQEKTTTIQEITATGTVHQFNYNTPINNTLIALCVKTGQLNKKEKYTLYFDHVVLENEKQDATKNYK